MIQGGIAGIIWSEGGQVDLIAFWSQRYHFRPGFNCFHKKSYDSAEYMLTKYVPLWSLLVYSDCPE